MINDFRKNDQFLKQKRFMTQTPNRLLNFVAVFLIQPKVSFQSSVMHLVPILFVFVAVPNSDYRKWHFMRLELIQC